MTLVQAPPLASARTLPVLIPSAEAQASVRQDFDISRKIRSRNHLFHQYSEGCWTIFEVFCVHDGLIHRLANYHFVFKNITQK